MEYSKDLKKKSDRCHFWTFPSVTMTTSEDDEGSGRGSYADDVSESFCSDEPQEIGGGHLFDTPVITQHYISLE